MFWFLYVLGPHPTCTFNLCQEKRNKRAAEQILAPVVEESMDDATASSLASRTALLAVALANESSLTPVIASVASCSALANVEFFRASGPNGLKLISHSWLERMYLLYT